MHRTSFVLLALSLIVVGCKKQPPAAPAPPAPVAAAPTKGPSETQAEAVRQLVENFARVHFALDSTSLDAIARDALTENAAILQRHPELRVEVQGHADERGTVDYNIALGARRAAAVRDHLVRMGVSPTRVATISYGEERPLASGAGEGAWSRNRRAEFRVLTPTAGVEGTTGT